MSKQKDGPLYVKSSNLQLKDEVLFLFKYVLKYLPVQLRMRTVSHHWRHGGGRTAQHVENYPRYLSPLIVVTIIISYKHGFNIINISSVQHRKLIYYGKRNSKHQYLQGDA